MPHDIKLKVYTLNLREINKPKESLFWSEIYSRMEGNNDSEKFINLFTKYIQSFDKKFIVYKNWPKGFTIPENKIKFNSGKYFVYGVLDGGTTNLFYDVKDINNTENTEYKVTADKIQSLPFHFIFYTPDNTNKALLIVQSLGDLNMDGPLKLHFSKFIKSIDEKYAIDYNEHITKAAEKKMKKGVLQKITLRRSHLPSDKADSLFKKEFKAGEELTIEVNITGFSGRVKEFLSEKIFGNHTDIIELESFEELGLDKETEVIARFEHKGKTASSKLENNIKLSPVYYVDNVELDERNHPKEKEMQEFLVKFTEDMIKEIGL
ncbi:MAG: hypothetical protein EOO44_00100 [Flavobacterium sp.]|nr:MAG: hypothetical protein EOO44_00100 [Flavobacterium sp.]